MEQEYEENNFGCIIMAEEKVCCDISLDFSIEDSCMVGVCRSVLGFPTDPFIGHIP